jgi:hypothetical protein
MALPHPATCGQPQGRAAEREDAALDLDLAEAGVAGGDADVGRERELDADGQAPALQGDDQGLAAHATEQAERVDGAVREQRLAAGDGGADLGEVEAGGEVLAVAEQQARSAPRGRPRRG